MGSGRRRSVETERIRSVGTDGVDPWGLAGASLLLYTIYGASSKFKFKVHRKAQRARQYKQYTKT